MMKSPDFHTAVDMCCDVLIAMHEKAKHRHNYYAHAALEIKDKMEKLNQENVFADAMWTRMVRTLERQLVTSDNQSAYIEIDQLQTYSSCDTVEALLASSGLNLK